MKQIQFIYQSQIISIVYLFLMVFFVNIIFGLTDYFFHLKKSAYEI